MFKPHIVTVTKNNQADPPRVLLTHSTLSDSILVSLDDYQTSQRVGGQRYVNKRAVRLTSNGLQGNQSKKEIKPAATRLNRIDDSTFLFSSEEPEQITLFCGDRQTRHEEILRNTQILTLPLSCRMETPTFRIPATKGTFDDMAQADMLIKIADTDSLIWSIRVDINRINDSYKIYDLKLGDSAELGDGDLLASDSVLNNLFNKLNDRRQARLFRDKIIKNKTTPIY